MSGSISFRSGWILAACVVALLLPLAATPVLPLIDFYNHVARYYVLSHLDDPLLARNYAAHWQLVPNLGLDLIGTWLLGFVPPLTAAKLIIALILLVQFGGLLALSRALGVRQRLVPALLAVALLYSYILNWGFGNFLLAIGLAFWAIAFWLRNRERPAIATIGGAILAFFVFLSHGFGFALYGLLLVAIEFGVWLEAKEPRAKLVRSVLLIASQAVLPAIFFIMSPTGNSSESALPFDKIESHITEGTLGERIWQEFLHRMVTIVRVAESPFAALDIAIFLVACALLVWALHRGVLRIRKPIIPALALLAILAVITPPAMFGVGFVSDRVPYVFALLLVAGLSVAAPGRREAGLVLLALCALALVRTGAVFIGWQGYGRDYEKIGRLIERVPPDSLLITMSARAGGKRDGGLRRCQMYAPVALVTRHILTPLFANPAQQPLLVKGRVKLVSDMETLRAERADQRDMSDDRILAEYLRSPALDYVLVCGAGRLRQPIDPHVKRIDIGRFTLLKLAP